MLQTEGTFEEVEVTMTPVQPTARKPKRSKGSQATGPLGYNALKGSPGFTHMKLSDQESFLKEPVLPGVIVTH